MAKKRGKTTEKGRYKQVRNLIHQIDGENLHVGYFEGEKPGKVKGKKAKSDFLLPDIASVNEYGTKNQDSSKRPYVPERSFMRTTFDQNILKYRIQFRRQAVLILKGRKTPEKALLTVGNSYRSDVIRKITAIRSPKNAKSTARRKGTNNPLIHTGAMKSRIRVKVFRGRR